MLARNVKVGDEVINDWSEEHMIVVAIEHGMTCLPPYRPRHTIDLHCVKGEHNKPETLTGSYWHSHIRVVRRGVKLPSALKIE